MFQNNQARLKLELYYRDHAVLQPSYYHDLVNELQKDNFRAIKLLRHLHWNPAGNSRETFANGKFKIVRLLGEGEVGELNVGLFRDLISGAVSLPDILSPVSCPPV